MVIFGTCSHLSLWQGVSGRGFLARLELETFTIRAGGLIDESRAERTAILEHRALLNPARTAIEGSITGDSCFLCSYPS